MWSPLSDEEGSAKASADNLDRPHCSLEITDSKSQLCSFLPCQKASPTKSRVVHGSIHDQGLIILTSIILRFVIHSINLAIFLMWLQSFRCDLCCRSDKAEDLGAKSYCLILQLELLVESYAISFSNSFVLVLILVRAGILLGIFLGML